MTDETLEIRDNTAENRYETIVEGHLAKAEYHLQTEDAITFTHTEVPSALNGRGIGSKLAAFALDDARQRHLHVIPLCPFIATYIKRHREYLDLVPDSYHDHVEQA